MISINDYGYNLPGDLIAKEPAVPRDSSKLFVYDTQKDKITFDRFINLSNYLSSSFLVLNKTKVVPSRLTLYKETGGKVVCLFLVNEALDEGIVRVIADREITVGQKLSLLKKYHFSIITQNKTVFTLKYDFSKEKLIKLLKKNGTMPIPPYLKDTSLTSVQLKSKYQTIFAQNNGSTAAPTASLHFSRRVFNKLEQKSIKKLYVELHVGMGTFSSINERNLETSKLHEEYFKIDKEVADEINFLKSKELKTVAVGTTVVRTLESSAVKVDNSFKIKENCGKTDIFIYPPYSFKIVDAMITNFHLPKSSLMMLVDAFLKHKKAKKGIMDLYKVAIENKFRFYSFGDAMLIL